jgi:hypothetical protein
VAMMPKRQLFLLAVLSALGSTIHAVPPSWWSANETRVLEATGFAQNYAPANLGQLKHVATQAKRYLDLTLINVGGAGASINNLVASFEPRQGQGYTPPQIAALKAANYAPINLGQLKAVAKPFYDRLIEIRYSTKGNLITRGYPSNWAFNYPWNPNTPISANYAVANLGQLKMTFSFEFADIDGDDLPDFWELHNGLDMFNPYDGTSDLDGDGLTAAHEFTNASDALIKTPAPPTPTIPAAPSNVHMFVLSDGSRYVWWDDNSDNEDYFIIREVRDDGTVVELARSGPGESSIFIPASQ